MPPRKRRQLADGDPGDSGDEGAGPGPSSRVAGLLDVLDAVLAHGRLVRADLRLLRWLCGRARLAVDGAIRKLNLKRGQDVQDEDGPGRGRSLRGLVAKLTGLHELVAAWDAALLSQVAVARSGMGTCAPLRRLALQLPGPCTLGPDFGIMLAAFPGLEVRSGPRALHSRAGCWRGDAHGS
jgi:hypothetical protein